MLLTMKASVMSNKLIYGKQWLLGQFEYFYLFIYLIWSFLFLELIFLNPGADRADKGKTAACSAEHKSSAKRSPPL